MSSFCVDCGSHFDHAGQGRPRKRCLDCSPPKVIQRRDHDARDCEVCGSEFIPKTVRSSVCSSSCMSKRKAYRQGLRCSICNELMWCSTTSAQEGAAHNACRRKRGPEHGKPGSYDRGCRCDECRAAKTASMREYANKYKERHGISPTAKLRRVQKGLPVESQLCVVCGDPLKISYFREGVEPRHKECKGAFYVPPALRAEVYERDEWLCHLCGEPTDPDALWYSDWFPSLDHVVPQSRGGTHELSNLKTAHRWCNSARGARSVEEFRSSIAGV